MLAVLLVDGADAAALVSEGLVVPAALGKHGEVAGADGEAGEDGACALKLGPAGQHSARIVAAAALGVAAYIEAAHLGGELGECPPVVALGL